MEIRLNRWSPTAAAASVIAKEGCEFVVAGQGVKHAKEVCMEAAQVLREAAQRFELLAAEDCQYAQNVQDRINAIDLEPKRAVHGPDTHPQEWKGDMYIGDDGYTMHLDAGGAFDAYFETKKKLESFTSMKGKATDFIRRLLIASPRYRVGYERLYRAMDEAGMVNKPLQGEDRRWVLDYAESLGFKVNRVYPNPVVAGQVYIPVTER